MTVIEIRPHRWGWKAFEAPGVEPVFPTKEPQLPFQALSMVSFWFLSCLVRLLPVRALSP